MLYQRIARVSATVRVHLDDVPLLPFFFFDVTAATEIYTLSLHDALPILLAINALGLMLLDYLSFAELVPLCEEAGRWSFLAVIAPLRLPTGTGSPVNPIAIL